MQIKNKKDKNDKNNKKIQNKTDHILFHKHITHTNTTTANITHLKQFNSDV